MLSARVLAGALESKAEANTDEEGHQEDKIGVLTILATYHLQSSSTSNTLRLLFAENEIGGERCFLSILILTHIDSISNDITNFGSINNTRTLLREFICFLFLLGQKSSHRTFKCFRKRFCIYSSQLLVVAEDLLLGATIEGTKLLEDIFPPFYLIELMPERVCPYEGLEASFTF